MLRPQRAGRGGAVHDAGTRSDPRDCRGSVEAGNLPRKGFRLDQHQHQDISLLPGSGLGRGGLVAQSDVQPAQLLVGHRRAVGPVADRFGTQSDHERALDDRDGLRQANVVQGGSTLNTPMASLYLPTTQVLVMDGCLQRFRSWS